MCSWPVHMPEDYRLGLIATPLLMSSHLQKATHCSADTRAESSSSCHHHAFCFSFECKGIIESEEDRVPAGTRAERKAAPSAALPSSKVCLLRSEHQPGPFPAGQVEPLIVVQQLLWHVQRGHPYRRCQLRRVHRASQKAGCAVIAGVSTGAAGCCGRHGLGDYVSSCFVCPHSPCRCLVLCQCCHVCFSAK